MDLHLRIWHYHISTCHDHVGISLLNLYLWSDGLFLNIILLKFSRNPHIGLACQVWVLVYPSKVNISPGTPFSAIYFRTDTNSL